MVFRLASRFGIADGAEGYSDLPAEVKHLYSHFTYHEIVRPLVCLDKKENPNLSFQAIANRYGISTMGAYQMIVSWLGREM